VSEEGQGGCCTDGEHQDDGDPRSLPSHSFTSQTL
jgi:hypothetical protein